MKADMQDSHIRDRVLGYVDYQNKIEKVVLIMARTFACNEEIIVVSKGTEDIGKLAMLGNDGKFDPSVIPAMQSCIPAGVVLHFAAATPPKGWLKADGNAVSRTEYADLFAVVGTTFGTGDGSTTFNLPDLRGEFIRGLDMGRGVDISRELGSSQADGIKKHNHNLKTETGDAGNDGCLADTGIWKKCLANEYAICSDGTHLVMSTFDSGDTETRPQNIALLACIKY
ncbi:microcystin-dependent protein [Sporomusaceae bacterium BoRhaA]|uniref:phage tail protein n=1 Tax=Pelorhabdus rhamnosifermentans TaxID=2772457 RepID=UPI0028A97CF9|nr:phage tail protein [Pelorhabdus rhamnosifermentans]MBU2700587.1 microcystin-dependent protein [Pelorhabdus rhamnosifermentans]